jgi:hypothetical protein
MITYSPFFGISQSSTYEFQRGDNTFKDLILKKNQMKVIMNQVFHADDTEHNTITKKGYEMVKHLKLVILFTGQQGKIEHKTISTVSKHI